LFVWNLRLSGIVYGMSRSPLSIAIEQANRKNYGLLKAMAGSCSTDQTPDFLLDLSTALKGFGLLTDANQVLSQLFAHSDQSLNTQATILRASIWHDMGKHEAAFELYEQLLQRSPDNRSLYSNFLLSQEYSTAFSDRQRYDSAVEWGRRIISHIGHRQRPKLRELGSSPLRIGYVSSDFCQHTVGLLSKDVITQHSQQVETYTYSTGTVSDWVTDVFREKTTFCNASRLSDNQLCEQIQKDNIDVLVDLSGHTGQSRLSVFALRPAPVMVSWLGYFATSGLAYIDAVLLDQWHVTEESQRFYVEKIIPLKSGRITYSPVPWMPKVAPLPLEKNGFITFGCFNNTNKLNDDVVAVWSDILSRLPTAKLILKWRTLNDSVVQERLWDHFEQRGVSRSRVELRGSSFHNEMLAEYGDIDIALDPFPFTGGLTSLEALYCGRPVITLPQSRVVSRQTYGFLSSIGMPACVALDRQDYVDRAVELATNTHSLSSMHHNLREAMRTSSLMRPDNQAKEIEQVLRHLYETIQEK